MDGGATALYSYDQNNRRYKKLVGMAATIYVWEGAQVVSSMIVRERCWRSTFTQAVE